jgi:hypothetical protein
MWHPQGSESGKGKVEVANTQRECMQLGGSCRWLQGWRRCRHRCTVAAPAERHVLHVLGDGVVIGGTEIRMALERHGSLEAETSSQSRIHVCYFNQFLTAFLTTSHSKSRSPFTLKQLFVSDQYIHSDSHSSLCSLPITIYVRVDLGLLTAIERFGLVNRGNKGEGHEVRGIRYSVINLVLFRLQVWEEGRASVSEHICI